jgi:8-oxo-dGTP diphosphatase
MMYTLCFLTRSDQVLLLRRNRPPNQGLWNGVGGRIEAGETPLQSCLREVREETGYSLKEARFAGLLTWEGFEIADGGLYLFTALAPPGEPEACSEGRLEWKTRAWAASHPDVVDNLHYILPAVLNGASPQIYHFVYQNGQIIRRLTFPYLIKSG